MTKYYIIIFVSLFSLIKSQESFEVKGKISNFDNEEILLSNVFIPPAYYEVNGLKAKIENEKFSLKNKLSYPHAYRIIIKKKLSGLIFIDKGVHTINIVPDSLSLYYPLVLSDSKINKELNNKFLPLYKKFIDKDLQILERIKRCSQDSLDAECKKIDFELLRKKIHIQQDSVIYEYSKINPNSYIPLWFIADKLKTYGFDEYQNKAFQLQSRKIKETKTGIELQKDLNIAKHFSNGELFPKMDLQKGTISTSLGREYTLIDFWFSNCAPCLQQIPKYKKIYDHYKAKGFEIVGVSTDETKYVGNWEKVVSDKKLNWKQLLDENGMEANKFNINQFPTTFLLDAYGKIIKKNISPGELEKFLEENLR